MQKMALHTNKSRGSKSFFITAVIPNCQVSQDKYNFLIWIFMVELDFMQLLSTHNGPPELQTASVT